MIGEIFYTLFVWPIYFILEFLFVLFIRIFYAPGPAIIFLSVVVNTLSLPIYLIADRWQKEDRDLQNRMKKKLASIRSVFKGDERQMIINAYYRQMGYSPVFILKASVGLLLQIPFFIAAYQFLSHTKLLSGVSFLFIRDLFAQDSLLPLPFSIFGINTLNLLPLLMTIINLFSSFIYAKNLGKREIIQLCGMALIFMVLLYKSPSGLVLYWTMNNIYSLVKNAAVTWLKKPGKVLQIAFLLAAMAFLILIWSGKASVERYRMLFTGIALLPAIILFLKKPLIELIKKIKFGNPLDEKSQKDTTALFYSSILLLFLLLGFLNPAQILSSSISDFEKPWSFMWRTALEGFSFLVLIPMFIKALLNPKSKRGLTIIWSTLVLNSLVCYFILSAYYGVMDRNFKLDDTDRLLHAFPLWISIFVPLASITIISLFISLKKERLLSIIYRFACVAIIILVFIDLIALGRGTRDIKGLIEHNSYQNRNMPIYFPLSKRDKNVFILFMDRAQGSAMSDALDYMPSLKEELDGFIFYPNTISFGLNTVLGIPAMLGGYNYTPSAINERKSELLIDKVNEAITLLPKLFGNAGYRVMITDPVIANMQSIPDISIFRDLPNVSASLLSGKFSERFRAEFPDSDDKGNRSFDFDIIFRYGLFRISPPALRYGIYYKGQWWREAAYNSYGRAIGEFSSLYYLSEICSMDDKEPTLNILMNAITHEGGSYNRNYFPQETIVEWDNKEIEKYGSKDNTEYIYILYSAMRQIVKWIDYLKAEGVYDNTRIIIVSDHGSSYKSRKASSGMESYNPLFMVKDFNNSGTLKTLNDFMTHADLPYLASKDIENLHFTDNLNIKIKDLKVFSAVSSQPLRHGPYEFNLTGMRELKGREVLLKESWGEWERF